MNGNRTATVDLGAISLHAGEVLAYSLFPSAGNPIWVFGCIDRQAILAVKDTPRAQYQWLLSPTAVPSPPSMPVCPTDRPVNTADMYVVYMSFVAVTNYRLLVVKQPGNVTIQDISYECHMPASYPEPLRVTLL
jgi:hypothetical protein